MMPVYLCDHCGKAQFSRKEIKKHLKQHELAYKCSWCCQSFRKRASQRSHTKNCAYRKKASQMLKCFSGGCLRTGTWSQMLKHYKNDHNLVIESSNLTFSSISEFQSWKLSVEERERVSYFQPCGVITLRSNPGVKILKFRCNRGQSYTPRLKSRCRLRSLKMQGSLKTGVMCPSSMTATITDDTILVDFCSHHLGHEMDETHLRISPRDREICAAKLAEGESMDHILESIKTDKCFRSESAAMRPIKRKDLHNLANLRGLNCSQHLSKNDIKNISNWAMSALREEPKNCPLIFFKNQGFLLPSLTLFERDDFMIILMTKKQREIFHLHGSGIICVDSIKGMKCYNFELIVISIVNEFGEGLPVSYCITNRSDIGAMIVFFDEVKKCLGSMTTLVFMTNVSSHYFNAWAQVMGQPVQKLFCSWLVEKNWRKNLGLISHNDLRKTVFQKLLCLQQVTDTLEFEKTFESFLLFLKCNEQTHDFYQFMLNNYSKCYEQWGMCYRSEYLIKVDTDLKCLHQRLSKIHLTNLKIKGLKQCIDDLMYFEVDKPVLRKRRSPNPKDFDIEPKLEDNVLTISFPEQSEEYSGPSDSKELNSANDTEIWCEECGVCLNFFSCKCDNSELRDIICSDTSDMALTSVNDQSMSQVCLLAVENDERQCQMQEDSTSHGGIETNLMQVLGLWNKIKEQGSENAVSNKVHELLQNISNEFEKVLSQGSGTTVS